MFHPPYGLQLIELVANPAAATNFVFTVPTGVIVQPMSIHFSFTSDANVADRTATILYQHQAYVIATIPPNTAQPASQTYTYTFGPGLDLQTAVPSLQLRTSTPHPIWLIPGDTIRSLVHNIQVGDQISAIYIYLNQYAA